ncbi:oxygenase MpaB family protein [Dietzia timorensis]|uniref:ER-bound oxygenase mpaB/mpaB'/Rubber oxygenase catalytic domain-containing protein n=1 Tax=Dietzia timorensis TaxID=499555 RepID=A0A173LII3_9ACTN|nr:oxygenase MpaB family protein [Dietzia timorensis]ANI91424.1 Hypothetical protein BJL86_0622 [Dietzia timorensis]
MTTHIDSRKVDPIAEVAGRRMPLRRHHWVDVIDSLDPVADAPTIHKIMAAIEFPWDYQRALELALFRTYCVPTVSDLLEATGEFKHRPQKRYDDTSLLMIELVLGGYEEGRGRDALRMINRNHQRYDISNDDMLYVLSTFVFDPLDWIDAYGWRRLRPNERLAAFHFYREVGIRMAIKNIPTDMGEFRSWRDEYEATHFAKTSTTVAVGGYTMGLFQSWFPAPVRPAVKEVVKALVDENMRMAFGYSTPPRALRVVAEAGLRARARVERLMPARSAPMDIGDGKYPTYPDYGADTDIGGIGACPFHSARNAPNADAA